MAKYVVRWRKGKGSWNEKTTNYKNSFKLANKKFAQGYEVKLDKIGGTDDRVPANVIKLVSDFPTLPQ